jgi:hypothetical protein
MAYVPASVPENTKDLLNRGLILYKKAFSKIILMAFVLAVVAFLPRILLLAYGVESLHKLSPTIRELGLVLVELLYAIFFTAMLWDMRCVMTNDAENVLKDFKTSLTKMPLIVGAAIIQGIILLTTTLTMFAIYVYSFNVAGHIIVPHDNFKLFLYSLPLVLQVAMNAYIFILLLFYLPIIVTEGKGIFSSLNRSVQLVWLNVWRVVKVQSVPWIMYGFFLIMLKNMFNLNLHIYFFPARISWEATLVHVILFALFVPWYAATLLVQLHDLEIRKQLKPFDQK